jgi:hypothetical protein
MPVPLSDVMPHLTNASLLIAAVEDDKAREALQELHAAVMALAKHALVSPAD